MAERQQQAPPSRGSNPGERQHQPQSSRGLNTLIAHVGAHKVDCLLWVTRMATLAFTFTYFVPLFGDPHQAYYKALGGNAATSALRLHQRLLPGVAPSFSRDFLARLMAEDSAHYLMFSLIFMWAQPTTVALLPPVLFALLHAASYSLTLLDVLGQNSMWGVRLLISLGELHSRSILRMAALTEIILLPIVVSMVFLGRASLLTPYFYYRFLSLRYASRRNPYSRSMFHELRLGMEEATSHPRCPQAIRNTVFKAVGFVSRLAPPQYEQS